VSRIVVFDLNNHAAGEFSAICNRGWILLGNPGVSDGGETTVIVPQDVILQPWLQLGRMVLVERPPLPAWVGVIDTPWTATLPAEITLYNAEYLISMRAAERSVAFNGSASGLVGEMLRLVNEQEETFIRIGQTDTEQASFNRVIEQRNIWDQLIKFLEESGYEMTLRPERRDRNQLYLYADVGVALGVDTGFLLHDGERANMKVIEAKVNGQVTNRVIGVSGKTTEEAQLQTEVQLDQDSQQSFRTRSEVVQFDKVTEISMLTGYTQAYLDYGKRPYLDLIVDVMDIDNTFTYLGQGNRLFVHASHVYLPGGIRGWSGSVRILAMAFDEHQNTVRTTLRGTL
jgi:hypothetical protein